MDQVEKVRILERIYKDVVFAIIRTSSAESALSAARTVIDTGIQVLEISLNTPFALKVIKTLSEQFSDSPHVIVGAGTVIDSAMASLVIDAGAQFIVSPIIDINIIKTGNRHGIPVIPGIATPTELLLAMEMGAEVVKGFPGAVLGTEFIKSLGGPLPQARVIPVGNVGKNNLIKWLDNGAYALGIGSDITHLNGLEGDEFHIKENVAEILRIVDVERRRRCRNA